MYAIALKQRFLILHLYIEHTLLRLTFSELHEAIELPSFRCPGTSVIQMLDCMPNVTSLLKSAIAIGNLFMFTVLVIRFDCL
jgi:hypothetical protein